MAAQNVSFIDPLQRGWDRMRLILFTPFDLGKWLVLGFTAWVAGLLDGKSTGGSSGGDWGTWGDDIRGDVDGAADFLTGLQENLVWLLLAGAVLALVLVVYVVLLWVSSRMKFVYLDNVIANRAYVSEPWKRLSRLGDSLFLWRLGFTFLCLVVLVAAILLFLALAGIDVGAGLGGSLTLGAVIFLVLAFLVLIVPLLYVQLFLDDFVVPIMYRYNLSTTAAWGRFLSLFRDHMVYFLLYGLFILLLSVLLVGVVFALAVLTCCLGMLILAIPYIGTLFLLPVLVTYRVYSLEFLGQFHRDLRFPSGSPG